MKRIATLLCMLAALALATSGCSKDKDKKAGDNPAKTVEKAEPAAKTPPPKPPEEAKTPPADPAAGEAKEPAGDEGDDLDEPADDDLDEGGEGEEENL